MTVNDYYKFDAQRDWQKARRKVIYKEVVCLIKRCSVDLLSFNEVRADLNLHQQQYLGIQEVPLERITGSVGRYDDFDAAFMPRKDFLKERWQSVEVAMIDGKIPPIDLYQVGDDYFVVDGNHRVSVSRQRGMETIEAHVTLFDLPPTDVDPLTIDQDLIAVERQAFIDKSGGENAPIVESIEFTCVGCYKDLANQIEDYRQGSEKLEEREISFAEAIAEWNEEVYRPSIQKIRENNLVDKFPGRTEADLFVWTSKKGNELEDLEMSGNS